MPRGDKRGNREAKKPKRDKAETLTPVSPFAPQVKSSAAAPPRFPGAKR
jgi:hypothetical protein